MPSNGIPVFATPVEGSKIPFTPRKNKLEITPHGLKFIRYLVYRFLAEFCKVIELVLLK